MSSWIQLYLSPSSLQLLIARSKSSLIYVSCRSTSSLLHVQSCSCLKSHPNLLLVFKSMLQVHDFDELHGQTRWSSCLIHQLMNPTFKLRSEVHQRWSSNSRPSCSSMNSSLDQLSLTHSKSWSLHLHLQTSHSMNLFIYQFMDSDFKIINSSTHHQHMIRHACSSTL